MDYQTKNAVAIFIFLRLETTLELIHRLSEVKPPRLYIVGEGYRLHNPNEKERVSMIREIIEKSIHWDCEVFTNYVEQDIGAGLRISSGISWVFEHEEQAIFLEDDTMPSITFFKYCDQLLEHYHDDAEIMVISGNNVVSNYTLLDSYTFSSIPFIWGWASWRRVWAHYDYSIKNWPSLRKSGEIKRKFTNPMFYELREKEFDLAFKGIDYTWDYQLAYLLLEKSGMCIVPKVNMVKNVGIGPDATNTKEDYKIEHENEEEIDFPLNHPCKIEINQGFDNYYFEHFLNKRYYSSSYVRFKYRFKKLIGNRLTSVLRHILKRK